MTDDKRAELERRLQAAGLAVMRIDDRDTLLKTVANLSKENRELLGKVEAMTESRRLLNIRLERAENAITALQTFAQDDYAVRHILEQAGVALLTRSVG